MAIRDWSARSQIPETGRALVAPVQKTQRDDIAKSPDAASTDESPSATTACRYLDLLESRTCWYLRQRGSSAWLVGSVSFADSSALS